MTYLLAKSWKLHLSDLRLEPRATGTKWASPKQRLGSGNFSRPVARANCWFTECSQSFHMTIVMDAPSTDVNILLVVQGPILNEVEFWA